MWQKTNASKEKQLRKVRKAVRELKNKKEIKEYLEFGKLSFRQKRFLEEDWNKYYKEVRKTRIYKNYLDMKAAFQTGNRAEVRRLKHESRKIIEHLNDNNEWLLQPLFKDPVEFRMGSIFIKYRQLLSQKKKLEEFLEIDETEKIFL